MYKLVAEVASRGKLPIVLGIPECCETCALCLCVCFACMCVFGYVVCMSVSHIHTCDTQYAHFGAQSTRHSGHTCTTGRFGVEENRPRLGKGKVVYEGSPCNCYLQSPAPQQDHYPDSYC